MTNEQSDQASQLADALRTIERQSAVIDRLTTQPSGSVFEEEVRAALLMTATVGSIGAPSTYSAALEHVVETASDVLDANAASLFIVDEETEELVFVVALGSKADQVRDFRIPIGEGIAGYVASTGQPISVADAEEDPRFAREVGEAIGHIPKTILCVPLFLGNRIIGVLEAMDKADDAHFTTRDIETLGRFANLAALTIEESRLTHDMRQLFRSLLTQIVNKDPASDTTLSFADIAADNPENADTIRLAGLVHDISIRGDAARDLTIETLSSLTRYLGRVSTEF